VLVGRGRAATWSVVLRVRVKNRIVSLNNRAVRSPQTRTGDHIIERAASCLVLMMDPVREIRGAPVACSSGA
jgi:hypothetical protein